jgi:hypothetical protein
MGWRLVTWPCFADPDRSELLLAQFAAPVSIPASSAIARVITQTLPHCGNRFAALAQ